MEDNMKEVYFNEYCGSCKHSTNNEEDSPCYECLAEPVNVESHKPVKYEEK